MIPLELRLVNILSHVDTVLDFTRLDKITLVIGKKEDDSQKSNGCGKSTMLEAIDWILFEASRIDRNKSLTSDDLVRYHQDFCEGVLVFIGKDNNKYKVRRRYEKKNRKVTLELHIAQGGSWKNKSKDGKKETQKEIIRILGFDQQVYENSTYCRQHEVAGIVDKDSGERLQLIKKLLTLDIYSSYANKAKEEKDLLNKQLQQFSVLLDQEKPTKTIIAEKTKSSELLAGHIVVVTQKAEIQKKKIETIRKELEELNKIIGAADQLKAQVERDSQRVIKIGSELEKLVTQREQAEKKLEGYRSEAQKGKARVSEIDNLKPDKTLLVAKYRQIVQVQSASQEKLGTLKATLGNINEKGKALKDEITRFEELGVGECPHCHNQVTKEHRELFLGAKEKEIGELRARGKTTKLEMVALEEVLTQHTTDLAKIKEEEEKYNKLIEERNTIAERMKSLYELGTATKGNLENYKNQDTIYRDELKLLKESLEETRRKVAQLNAVDIARKHASFAEQIKNENSILEAFQREIATHTAAIAANSVVIEEKKKLLTQIEQSIEQTKVLSQQIRILEMLQVDFAKTIPTMILENCAVVIEEEVNKCLRTLSDGFAIKIKTQHQNKTNSNVSEVFDIEVTIDNNTCPIECLSGGEAFRVAFAIRVALGIVLTQEAGIKIGAMFYDEPFVDLDEDGINKLQEVFVYLAGIFEHQLAITHQSQLKELFNDVLVVEKGPQGAKLVQSRTKPE